MQKNLLEYLEQTARRTPEAPALTDEAGTVTFRSLLDWSRRLGTRLARVIGAANRPVAVLTERRASSIAGFLGVLFSGNFYVPLDVHMPPSRMQCILEQLQPAGLVFDPADRNAAAQLTGLCPFFSTADGDEPDAQLLQSQRRQVLDVDPAYVIFTSGSTGTPKGIAVSHRSVIDFTDWYVGTCGITGSDRLGNQAPFFFDLSVKDLYSTLKAGASMYILPRTYFSFPILLARYLREQKITVLSWATSAFHLVANSGVLDKVPLDSLRLVIVGGEALQARQLNLWRRALPQVQYINLYGPTEVTVDCCYYFIDREFADGEPVPIGRACENMEVFLLDETGKPCPQGTPGELCVRGSGLALGYFGLWDKTHAAFTQDPRNPWYLDRIYHTGDLAVEDSDGNFHFLSRKDGQVKHAGYRIELGEIETVLSGLPGVESAVCLFDAGRDRIHCIYSGSRSGNELAAELRSLLPKYMVPNLYHQIAQMPYSANGKLDRTALKQEFLHEAD